MFLSKFAFFSNGRTIACLKISGTTALAVDMLMSLVTSGEISLTHCFRSVVVTGTSSQDLEDDLIISLLVSSSVIDLK